MRKPIRHAMMWGKNEDDSIYVFPVQQTNGNWVKWEDYSKLQAEVERLTNLQSGADYFKAKEDKPSV